MRELTYEQSTGKLWYVDDATPEKAVRLGVGYSGAPPFVNQTEAEALKARGPIPRGSYGVRLLGDLVRFGPQVLFLEPLKGTEMFGRSGFLIHGDNEYGNRTASSGCIVLPRGVRDRIAALLPVTLQVV